MRWSALLMLVTIASIAPISTSPAEERSPPLLIGPLEAIEPNSASALKPPHLPEQLDAPPQHLSGATDKNASKPRATDKEPLGTEISVARKIEPSTSPSATQQTPAQSSPEEERLFDWYRIVETLSATAAGAAIAFMFQIFRDKSQRIDAEIRSLMTTYFALVGQRSILGQINEQIVSVFIEEGEDIHAAIRVNRCGEALAFPPSPCAELTFLMIGSCPNLPNEIQIHENIMNDMMLHLSTWNTLKLVLEEKGELSEEGQILVDPKNKETQKKATLIHHEMEIISDHCQMRMIVCESLLKRIATEVNRRTPKKKPEIQIPSEELAV